MPNHNGGTRLRDRPLGEIAQALTRDVSLLVRQEVELAKAEMTEKGRVAAPGLGMIGAAGMAGAFGGGCSDGVPDSRAGAFLGRVVVGADCWRRVGGNSVRACYARQGAGRSGWRPNS